MWCGRMIEKISWPDHVRNEEILQRVNEYGNILQTTKRGKTNWIGHTLHQNCLIKQVTEGKIGMDKCERKTKKKM
jgi:hypothetical protein